MSASVSGCAPLFAVAKPPQTSRRDRLCFAAKFAGEFALYSKNKEAKRVNLTGANSQNPFLALGDTDAGIFLKSLEATNPWGRQTQVSKFAQVSRNFQAGGLPPRIQREAR
jgi:hypothetical protein